MARRRRGRRSTRNSRGPNPAAGGAIGAGVFIVGLILTVLIVQLELSRTLAFITAFAGWGGASALDGYILSFIFVHDLGLTSGDFLTELLPFTLIMIVLHFIGGAVAARAGGGGPASGASIAVGFGALTTLSVLYLLVTFGGSAGFELILSLIFVGVVYPVVFGGLGGLVGG